MFDYRPRPTSARRVAPRFESSKWRVVSERPLLVSGDLDGHDAICDLEPGSTCDVLHEDLQTLADGTLRAMIVDPVWKGYVTLRKSNGESNLEHLDGAPDRGGGSRLGGTPAAAAIEQQPAPKPQVTVARILELRDESFALDIECDMDEMVLWSDEEVGTFFATGGATAPPTRRHLAASSADASCEPSAPSASSTALPDVSDGGAHGSDGAGSAAPAPAASDAPPATKVEMSEGQRKARDAGQWPKGFMVMLTGLTSMRELNGRSGVLQSYDEAVGRYEVRMANRVVRARPQQLAVHPIQKQRDAAGKGDEVVFLSEDAQLARAGTYAVRLDPQFWYDQALERVFEAANEFEVLELPVELCEDLTKIKKQYRKISLSVHPDKNQHPQADAAFRKVYGAFETLSDMQQQRRLLFELGLDFAPTEKEKAEYERAGAEDDDDVLFQWWWEASVPDVEKAAEEAEGADLDSFAASWVSDGLGGDVNDVRWMGIKKAIDLHKKGRVILIDCRERADYAKGGVPGAWHVPMSAVMRYGIVNVLGNELIHELLSTRRNSLIVVYSQVATPFSRCRAFCRWLLRAGHSTLPAQRFRRLRGGLFGWEHRGGEVAKQITMHGMNDDLEERLKNAEKVKDLETLDLE